MANQASRKSFNAFINLAPEDAVLGSVKVLENGTAKG